MRKHIKGTGILFPILMRQHRLRLLLWLSGLVLVSCSVAYAYPDLYPDPGIQRSLFHDDGKSGHDCHAWNRV